MKNSKKRRFLLHKVICIPTYDHAQTICDFVFQTAYDLAAQNVVIILALGDIFSGRKGWQTWQRQLAQVRQAVNAVKKRTKKKNQNGHVFQIGFFQFIPFQRFEWSRQLNARLNLSLISRILSLPRRPKKDQLLWMFDPKEAWLLPFFSNWHLHFDCVDWYQGNDVRRKLLVRQADSLTALTKRVQKKLTQLSDKVVALVPQGFDLTKLRVTQPLPVQVTRQLNSLQPKVLIGFFGGISQRLDVDLLYQVVAGSPEWQFLFVGPIGKDENVGTSDEGEEKLHELLKLPNVTHIPSLPRTMLLPFMKKCAILLIPYDLQWEFNRCCFPMKLIEYFFAGRPVVATSIPSLRQYFSFVITADKVSDFQRALQQEMYHPWTLKQKKSARQIALDQTWQRKLDQVDAYLGKMVPSA